MMGITQTKQNIRRIIAGAVFFVAAGAQAQSATTKEGYLACLTMEDYEDVLTFLNASDDASINAYIEARKCIALKAGMVVTITDHKGVFGQTVEFAYQGLKLWTATEALSRNN